jgi:hypothetical protein
MTLRRFLLSPLSVAAFVLVVIVIPREPADLRLGQKVYVDDGTCKAGEVKEVIGSTLTPNGVARTRKCVPRK